MRGCKMGSSDTGQRQVAGSSEHGSESSSSTEEVQLYNPVIYLEGQREIIKNLCHDNWSTGGVLNLGHERNKITLFVTYASSAFFSLHHDQTYSGAGSLYSSIGSNDHVLGGKEARK
jgi:hypothetical protein